MYTVMREKAKTVNLLLVGVMLPALWQQTGAAACVCLRPLVKTLPSTLTAVISFKE